MIPRHQLFLFLVLLIASAAMGGLLWHLHEQTHERLLAGEDSAPTRAPNAAPLEQATLMIADDSEDALDPRALALPLPAGSAERARALLSKLLDLYAAPGAAHPVPVGGDGIANVFLLPANGSPSEQTGQTGQTGEAGQAGQTGQMEQHPGPAVEAGGELAVVNLTAAFAANHPSGIETETLTIRSICATLHANLPLVTEVRFLVDGQPRDTLAGHADLTRTYRAAQIQAAMASVQP